MMREIACMHDAGYLVTSESVTEGHPDKLCDQISDAILDACLAADPKARVAVETMVSPNVIFIAGEVSVNGQVDYVSVARKTAREIGFVSQESGLDCEQCLILTNINTQSPDIAMGVSRGEDELGAGDQGIMYGYASDESDNYMPKTCELANLLSMRLAQVRKDGTLPWLYPDGKTQVTMRYSEDGKPMEITGITVSAHHQAAVDQQTVRRGIVEHVICPVLAGKWDLTGAKIHINPTGSFTIGGPAADTGLTGRKIMVDTYGGVGKHGGGAFSGKDPTKVDRSAAYMARYVAKHVVAAGFAERCEVSLAYAIGLPQPEAVTVQTFGTERMPRWIIEWAVRDVFSFSVADILRQLELRRPQYRASAVYGHFGREDQGFHWECLDRVEQLKDCVKQYLLRMQ